jgi:hypothetical protein
MSISIDFESLNFNGRLITLAMLGVANENSKPLPYSWVMVLQRNIETCVEWCKLQDALGERTVIVLLEILNPNSRLIANDGAHLSRKLLQTAANLNNSALTTRVCAFVFALGFNLADSDAVWCIEQTFEGVYLAASRDDLDSKSWNFIDRHTQPLAFWNDWDKCKKLVKTVASFIVNSGFKFDPIKAWINSAALRDRLIKHIKKVAE